MRIKVPLENLLPNPFQPKSRLFVPLEDCRRGGKDILKNGMVYVPKARMRTDLLPLNGFSQYELADGWQRRGWHQWLVENGHPYYAQMEIDEADLSDQEMADMIHSANDLRREMSAIEKGEYYQAYIENFGISQKELGDRLGLSQAVIANTIRLSGLPDFVKKAIISQEIDATHGRYLLRLNSFPDAQKQLLERIKKDSLRASETDYAVTQTIWTLSRPLEKSTSQESPQFVTDSCKECKLCDWLSDPVTNFKFPRCLNGECWNDKQESARAAVKITEEKQAPLPGTLSEVLKSENPPEGDGNKQTQTDLNTWLKQTPLKTPEQPEKLEDLTPGKTQFPSEATSELIRKMKDEQNALFEKAADVIANFDINKPGAWSILAELLVRGWVSQQRLTIGRSINKFSPSAPCTEYYHALINSKKIPDDVLPHFIFTAAFEYLQSNLPGDTFQFNYMINQLRQGNHTTHVYRIFNRELNKFSPDIEHKNAMEALQSQGWMAEDCEIKEQTDTGGWKLVHLETKAEIPDKTELDEKVVLVNQTMLKEFAESYSVETIPAGKIKKPFLFDNNLYIMTGGSSKGDVRYTIEAYKIVNKIRFQGNATNYNNKQKDFSYHGVMVTRNGIEFVIVEPKTIFRDPDAEKIWASHYPELVEKPVTKTEPEIVEIPIPPGVRESQDVPSKECKSCGLDTADHTLDMRFAEKTPFGTAYRRVCLKDYQKWEASQKPGPEHKEDFTTLQVHVKTAERGEHKMTCSGRTATGENLSETAVGLCRELGIKFTSPAELVEVLKSDYPDNPMRAMLIGMVIPEKVAT